MSWQNGIKRAIFSLVLACAWQSVAMVLASPPSDGSADDPQPVSKDRGGWRDQARADLGVVSEKQNGSEDKGESEDKDKNKDKDKDSDDGKKGEDQTKQAEESKEKEAKAVDDETKANELVTQGQKAISEARYDDAIELFDRALELVPGLPEAVQGKEQALQHITVEDSENMTLVQKIRQRDRIMWERAVTKYRELDEQIRENVIKGRFDEAKRLLQSARTVIEASKQYASPVEKYENLRSEAEALSGFVADEERRWNEQQILIKRRDAERIQMDRQQEVQRRRQEKIELLMDQAFELRKERDFNGAIEVLKQVRAIDPNNDKARYMMDVLEDAASMQEQVAVRDSLQVESRDMAAESDRTKIPWHKDVLFPSNWLEITASRSPFSAGSNDDSPENRAVQEKLQQTIPEVAFEATPFESIISFLADQNEVSIHVNWSALEFAGIDRDVEVQLKLANVRLEKAIELILDDVGGGDIKLGYMLDEGIILISTREDLDTKTTTEVYDIRDLIIQIPSNYDAPQLDLNQIIQAAGQRGGGGGQSIFRDEQQDESDELEEEADELIEEILDLIRSTISPDSWREAGGIIGSVRELNGLLVVTQTAAAHKAIQDLLEKLRGPRAIQIAIETRFLTVQSNFLEEIGTDLDIILNQGNAGFDFIGGRDSDGNPLPPVTDPATGGRLLVPREFTRLGVLPLVTPSGSPFRGSGGAGGVGGANPFRQPFGQVGLVPGSTGSGRSPIPLLNNSINLASASNAVTNVPGSFGGEGNLASPAFQAFGSFLDNIQVDFLIKATQVHQRSTLVTAPKIVLFNGQRSFVAVTQTQAFISDLNIVIGDQAGAPDPQVSSVSAGTVLEVEATVSADRRYVTLTIAPRIARILQIADFPVVGGSLTVASGVIQLPEVQVTTLKTSVQVPDGGTVLLGGQKLSGEVEIEAGVPILSKIPGLKRLFSNTSTVKDESTLLILVQPKIILQEEAEQEAFPSLSMDG